MAVIRKTDIAAGMQAFDDWCAAAHALEGTVPRTQLAPQLPRPVMALAVRYSLHMLELKAPGPGVEVRVASGVTTWNEERAAGHITAVGERDDLSALLPLG